MKKPLGHYSARLSQTAAVFRFRRYTYQ